MERAINAFLGGYRAIRAQLETGSHNNPKAEGLAKLASDGHVIIYILLLKSVVRHLQKLSKYLQTTGLSLADAYNRVAATKTVLLNMMGRFWGQRSVHLSELFLNTATECG
ncbi:uncharacterized protein LOC123560874 [Mercenaria mercenaria]|nr:uncharacterized protein LOC123560874 [Mercenaria mercenaria]